MWCFRGLSWLPLCTSLMGLISIFVPYCIAVSRGDVIEFLPYISDSGALPPESCVFGVLLNATAYSFLLCGIVRFLQIREHLTHDMRQVRWNNCLSLAVLTVGSVGLSIVACFQETSQLTVHMTGALMAFGAGVVYTVMQLHLSYRLVRDRFFKHKILIAVRCILALVGMVAFFNAFYFSHEAKPHMPNTEAYKKGESHSGRTDYYLTSTISEWTMAIVFFLYIATFSHELSYISISFIVATRTQAGPVFVQDNDLDPIVH